MDTLHWGQFTLGAIQLLCLLGAACGFRLIIQTQPDLARIQKTEIRAAVLKTSSGNDFQKN